MTKRIAGREQMHYSYAATDRIPVQSSVNAQYNHAKDCDMSAVAWGGQMIKGGGADIGVQR